MQIALVASPSANLRSGATGGAERTLFLLGDRLRTRGHTVSLYASKSQDLPDSVRAIPYFGSGRLRAWTYSLRALQMTRAADGIIAVNCPQLALCSPSRCVLYVQHYGLELPLLRGVARKLASRRWQASTIAVCAESPAEWLRETIKFPGRIRVIPNGVDVRRFTPPLTKDGPPYVVAFAGQWNRMKGFHIILETARQLEHRRDITFCLAGSRRLWGDFDGDPAITDALSRVPANVELVGELPHTEMESFWAKADVAVLPSTEWFEGMPLSVLEAMASGVPVIATDVPGNRDLIVDGMNGRLVRPGVSGEIAQALQEVLDNPEKRREWGLNARQTAMVHSLDRQAESFEHLFGQLSATLS